MMMVLRILGKGLDKLGKPIHSLRIKRIYEIIDWSIGRLEILSLCLDLVDLELQLLLVLSLELLRNNK